MNDKFFKLKIKRLTITMFNFQIHLSKLLGLPAVMWNSPKEKFGIIFFYMPKIFAIPGFMVLSNEKSIAIRLRLIFSLILSIETKKKFFINDTLLSILLQLGLVILIIKLIF